MSFFVVARFARNVVRSVDTKERERDRERKRREKLRIFSLRFPLSLFFQNPKHTYFFQKEQKGKNKKSCHDGWNTTSVVCKEERRNKEKWTRQPPAETTCRRSRKKRRGEKPRGREEGEEHEKARGAGRREAVKRKICGFFVRGDDS